MDFRLIRKPHVDSAIDQLRRGEVPAGFKPSIDYDVFVGAERFPPKQVVAFAYQAAAGVLPKPSDFEGGRETAAFRALRRCGFKVEKKQDSFPRSWIFQGNPKLFRMDDYLSSRAEVVWSVNQHKDDIELGDRVYFWRSGPSAGIVAIGRVISPVMEMADDVPELWIGPPRKVSKLSNRVRVRVLKLLEPIVSRQRVGEILPRMAFLRASQGTNFSVKSEDADVLSDEMDLAMIDLSEELGITAGALEAVGIEDRSALTGPSIKGKEGRKMLLSHYVRERNPALSREAKRLFAAKHKFLACEACGVIPLHHYGVEVIEAHHKVPLSKGNEEREISPADFLMLCPSCHRAIHRMPDCSFDALLHALKRNRQ